MPVNIIFVIHSPVLELTIRKILRWIHVGEEWRARFVNQAANALEIIKSGANIDILFTELDLPGKDGLALIENIHQYDPIIRSVLFSSKDDKHTIRKALNVGVFDFVLLPLNSNDFTDVFKKVIKQSITTRQTISEYEEIFSLEQDLEIARQIQNTVISPPNFTSDNGKQFEISGFNHPAEKVGGDFYDYFYLEPNKLGFVIGDVASKGLPAALFMAVSKTLFKSIALKGLSPDECLRIVNKMLFMDSDPSLFIAIFYGIIDLLTGNIIYCNGGHTYPYMIDIQGKLISLSEPGGIVLGAIEDTVYPLQSTRLMQNQTLFLYTDGFQEIKNNKNSPQLEQILQNLIEQNPRLTIPKIIESLFKKVSQHNSHTKINDDLTCLGLRYLGAGEKKKKSQRQRIYNPLNTK